MKRWILPIFALSLLAFALAERACGQAVVSSAVSCATSIDGTVVGTVNPLLPPAVATGFTGTLPAGNYYIEFAWYDASGHLTLPSPERKTQLSATGQLQVQPPSTLPQTAVGMKVYIGTSGGGETLQGTTVSNATFTQSTPLTTGTALPTTNNTVCRIAANDAGWPTGTGYKVTMTSPAGNTVPGFPMQWQLLGPGNTINVSNGLPLYNGNVIYPIPILARPYNHSEQSISGPLSLANYDLLNVGAIGVGTGTPGWAIDVETGAINASGGYLVNGNGGTTGYCLGSDGVAYRVPITCVSGLPSVFYQTVASNGSAQTQRNTLNFSTNFTTTDASSPSETTIELSHTGTAGTYASPASITFDAFGRETAITASSAVNTVCTGTTVPYTCYRVEADGTMTAWGAVNVPASGNYFNTASFTYTVPFTTTPEVQVTTVGLPSTTGDAATPIACELQSSSTTGATAYMARVIVASAGGGNFDQAITLNWEARGK